MELLKQNIENAVTLSSRTIKSVTNERIKHSLKPLSDVKNILSDKNCLSQRINKKESEAEVYRKEEPQEYDDPLYYFDDASDDDYRDIVPLALQLTLEDVKSLSQLFVVPHYEEDKRPLDPLPLAEIPKCIDEDPYLYSYNEMIEIEPFYVF